MSERPNVTVVFQDAKPDDRPGFLDWLVVVVCIPIMLMIFIEGVHW